MFKRRFLPIAFLLIVGLLSSNARSQGAVTNDTTTDSTKTVDDSTHQGEKKETPKKKKKPKEPEFNELIEDFDKIEGLFTLYQNEKEGKVYLEIKPEQFGTVYLVNITRESGEGSLFDAGALLGSFPFFFKQVGKTVQMIEKNVRFRADPDGAIARAVKRDFSNSISATAKIASQPHPERGSLLVDADELFLNDIGLVGYVSKERKLDYSYDKTNSYFSEIKSFPLNTEIEVTLHFKSSKPQPIYSLADSRSMLHRYHYSISTIAETDYKPRIADDRVGHFLTMYQDYSSVLHDSPYKRYIERWHLEKSEPKFNLSPPKQPIVFWLENTIPVEYRDAVREGILLWNKAFEKIGFKDAIVVKQMPDDADWDPADVRYNTIRWIVQPGAAYAVGPSTANPFTGQIYDADIRVSADYVRWFYREFDEFVSPASWTKADMSVFLPGLKLAEPANYNMLPYLCTYASGMAHQMAFGWDLLLARGKVSEDSEDLQKFIHDGIVDLIVHEVGHTLGLRHNFKASSVYTLDQLGNKSFTEENGVTGSVMDYNPVNLAPKGKPQGDYFHTTLGPYDYWAIEYAYKPLPPNSKISEEEMLDQIASRDAKPELQYGSDEDALRFSTRGIDPLCTYYDLGKDPMKFWGERLEMSKELWADLPKDFEKDGARYQKLRLAFSQGITEYALASMNITKFIGGIYSYRDHVGDPNGRIPFVIVPAEKQRSALKFITENIFAKNAFQFSPELLNKLAAERFPDFQGTVWKMTRIDYPIHGIIQLLQVLPMNRLYDPLVLQRIQDNELRFKKGETPFTMAELFSEIRKAIWQELDEGTNINSFRRELQRMHLYFLGRMVVKSPAMLPHDAITLARADLVEIKNKIDQNLSSKNLDAYTKAHLEETAAKIDAALTAQMQAEF